jgi:hypothetical protein
MADVRSAGVKGQAVERVGRSLLPQAWGAAASAAPEP